MISTGLHHSETPKLWLITIPSRKSDVQIRHLRAARNKTEYTGQHPATALQRNPYRHTDTPDETEAPRRPGAGLLQKQEAPLSVRDATSSQGVQIGPGPGRQLYVFSAWLPRAARCELNTRVAL